MYICMYYSVNVHLKELCPDIKLKIEIKKQRILGSQTVGFTE